MDRDGTNDVVGEVQEGMRWQRRNRQFGEEDAAGRGCGLVVRGVM